MPIHLRKISISKVHTRRLTDTWDFVIKRRKLMRQNSKLGVKENNLNITPVLRN